jgi:hypothetical protein
MTSCTGERTTTSLENDNLKKVQIPPVLRHMCGKTERTHGAKWGSSLITFLRTRGTNMHTCYIFFVFPRARFMCPFPTQISYNSLWYKHCQRLSYIAVTPALLYVLQSPQQRGARLHSNTAYQFSWHSYEPLFEMKYSIRMLVLIMLLPQFIIIIKPKYLKRDAEVRIYIYIYIHTRFRILKNKLQISALRRLWKFRKARQGKCRVWWGISSCPNPSCHQHTLDKHVSYVLVWFYSRNN